MTNQECYDRVMAQIDILKAKKNLDDKEIELLEELRISAEAISKQIPKKVTHEASLLRCFTCPTCKNVIDEFNNMGNKIVLIKRKNCKFCGQVLDWGQSYV